MFGPAEFRELISGRRRGPLASLARCGLQLLEWPYAAAVRWRNHRYDTGSAATVGVEVPVISVGNITLGGTGKTPAVEWLARWFSERQVRVVLVSRGYASRAGAPNDEARELAEKLPQVPHVQDPDRVRGARVAIERYGARLILLDDAFQHRRIARDLDIVLVDALEPFGWGHVFPRGTLREPLTGWQRADVVMLTRSELIDDQTRSDIRAQVARYAPGALWVESIYAPQALVAAHGEHQSLSTLAGQGIAAFCGIGNPLGFRQALDRCGYRVVGMRELPDHFAYPQAQVDELARWSDSLDAAAVVCTCKDLVKIERWSGQTPLWALSARLQITAGQEQLLVALNPLAARARQ